MHYHFCNGLNVCVCLRYHTLKSKVRYLEMKSSGLSHEASEVGLEPVLYKTAE